ncbi:MAG: hypothetical protein IKW85_06780 [Muribaculaceae bacterium]|nr:hypothetical protein [Muribaculaceae bacterium]
MKEFLRDYFGAKGDARPAEDYSAFCEWIHDPREFSEGLTSGVFANLELKKAMAKRIVNDMMRGGWGYGESGIIDQRLRALVTYYFNVALFSQDPEVAASAADAIRRYRHHNHQMNIDLDDKVIKSDPSPDAIVTMRPEDDFYRGYRLFIINMLCFTSSRFVIGLRTDGGPVSGPMKYYKGCRPLGIGTAKDGLAWNLVECNNALSDDHQAILSNALDGDGTIEICDWINDDNQRIIFRTCY